MGTSAVGLGFQGYMQGSARKDQLADEQRRTQLETLLQNATSPQDQAAAIQDIYAKDPSKAKILVENLVRRMVGKSPVQPESPYAVPSTTTTQEPVVNPATGEPLGEPRQVTVRGPAPRTRQEALAGLAARGKMPEQKQADMERMQEEAAVRLQKLKNEGMVNRGNATRPVPYYAGAVNKPQAMEASQAGKVYADSEGNPIDVSKIPEGMFLLPIFSGGGKEYYELATDKMRYESAGNQRLAQPAIGGPNPNAPSIGLVRVPVERSSTTTDPFGVTSTTSSRTTPVTTPARVIGDKQEVRSPAPRSRTSTGVGNTPSKGRVSPTSPRKLDATGHIPLNAGNPMLVQAANSLIDGMDVEKIPIPQRDRAGAMKLASEYGWAGQGTFTPQQKVLINEAGAKLQQLATTPFLSVLDNPSSRAKIATVLSASDPKSGTIHNLVASQIAQTLTPQEQGFIRAYNAAVGVISGLGPLTRGNRATEAAVNRLMIELPSILQSASSEDAKLRVQQLLQEIEVAQQTTGTTPLGGSPSPRKNQGDDTDLMNRLRNATGAR